MTQVPDSRGRPVDKLTLYPRNAYYAWRSHKNMLQSLRLIELIGESYGSDSALHQVGGKFLSLVTFLGCAPNIEIESGDDEHNLCLVEIPPATSEPALRVGANAKLAACPHCRARIEPVAGAAQVVCGNCHATLPAWTLNWRKTACCARVCINIQGVYESEAVPTPRLLDQLRSFSTVPWDYCYLRH